MADHQQSYYKTKGQTFSSTIRQSKRLFFFNKCLLPLLPKDKKATIVDFGCGTGDFVQYAQSLGYLNTYGYDTCADSINKGKHDGADKIVCCTAEAGLQRHEAVDFILFSHFIEHLTIECAIALLSECKIKMANASKMVVIVPNVGSPMGINGAFGDLTHRVFYNEQSLRQLLLISGFTSIDISETPPRRVGARGLLNAACWPILRFVLRLQDGFSSGHLVYSAEVMATCTINGK